MCEKTIYNVVQSEQYEQRMDTKPAQVLIDLGTDSTGNRVMREITDDAVRTIPWQPGAIEDLLDKRIIEEV